jgi:hypothetical protein
MALNLSGTKLRGRIIKVQRKRTNIKGMSKIEMDPKNILVNQFMGYFTKQNIGYQGGKSKNSRGRN